MAYLQYVMVNDQKIGIDKVDRADQGIIIAWRDEGYLAGTSLIKMEMTEEFWHIICEIIYWGYVAYDTD